MIRPTDPHGVEKLHHSAGRHLQVRRAGGNMPRLLAVDQMRPSLKPGGRDGGSTALRKHGQGVWPGQGT